MMKIFSDKPFQVVKQGLDFSYRENSNIANNLANIETPGYRGKRLQFKETLRDIVEGPSTIPLKTTDPGHIPVARGGIMEPRNATLKNLNVDTEMAELAKNSILYNTYVEILNRKQDQIKTVLREVR